VLWSLIAQSMSCCHTPDRLIAAVSRASAPAIARSPPARSPQRAPATLGPVSGWFGPRDAQIGAAVVVAVTFLVGATRPAIRRLTLNGPPPVV